MKLLRAFVLVAVFPVLAGATVITSGTITIFGPNRPGSTFNFSGPGFSASGALFTMYGWDLIFASVAPPGTTVSVNGFPAGGDDFGGGSATVDGMNVPSVNWGETGPPGSFFNITGPPITLNAGPGTYQSTFTLVEGALCAGPVPFPPPPRCTVVDLPDLTGAGVVSANYGLTTDGRFLQFTSATYTFVPEPGTWLLVSVWRRFWSCAGSDESVEKTGALLVAPQFWRYQMKLLRSFVLVAVFPLLTEASVITSGTITIMEGPPFSNFNFSGPGFSASGGLSTIGWDLIGIDVLPGTTVKVDGNPTDGDSFGGGSATIDGMNFNNVLWGPFNPPSSMFNITGPPITLNAGPGTYQSTFTFTGNLCGVQVPE